jgi:hypothetical protein
MSTRLQNCLSAVTLATILVVTVSQFGCQPLSSYRQRYSIRLFNADDESPAMVDNLILIAIDEYDEPFLNADGSVYGTVKTPDESGLVEYDRGSGAICVDGGNKNYPACEDAAKELDITGSTFRFLVEDGDYTESIEIEMQVGNRVVGDEFVIEVESISPIEEVN